jgi:hypothetical protein
MRFSPRGLAELEMCTLFAAGEKRQEGGWSAKEATSPVCHPAGIADLFGTDRFRAVRRSIGEVTVAGIHFVIMSFVTNLSAFLCVELLGTSAVSRRTTFC